MEANACSIKKDTELHNPNGMVIRKTKTFKEDKKLCNLVAQHPQLYDKGHKGYGQKKATDEAWRTIAYLLGKSASQCKARWEILCAEYTAYLRSVEERRLSRSLKETEVATENLDNEHSLDELLRLMQDMTRVIHEITEFKNDYCACCLHPNRSR